MFIKYLAKFYLNIKFHGTINDPLPVLPGKEQDLSHKKWSTLTCFTKCTKCMTLSALEISFPMQRSHDTLVSDISA